MEPRGDRNGWPSEPVHIDVRGLPPPDPMVAILRLIDSGLAGTVIARLDREPVFLYPELEDRGWCYELVPSPARDAGVVLRITRSTGR